MCPANLVSTISLLLQGDLWGLSRRGSTNKVGAYLYPNLYLPFPFFRSIPEPISKGNLNRINILDEQ